MTEYTVHFQKGFRVGTRSLRMERTTAETATAARKQANRLFPGYRQQGYRVTRVDHFDGDTHHLVIDY